MSRKLVLIYQKLHRFFGPQHWWPADNPLEVMVGAILTQNTTWSSVEKAIANLKKAKLLSASRLYRLPAARIAKLIRPSGYYNIKTKRLLAFLSFLFQTYQGDIRKMSGVATALLRRQLLEVNGIGEETADSILLYALGKPVFVVDAYTKRILGRHRLIRQDANYQEVQNFFMKNLQNKVKLFNEYHALLVRLGKEFCAKTKPRCQVCPLGEAKI